MNGEQDMTESAGDHSETDGLSREEKRARRLRRIQSAAVLLFVVPLLFLPLLWGVCDYLYVYRIPKGTTVVDDSAVREYAPCFDFIFRKRIGEKYWPYLYYRRYIVSDGATEIRYGAFTGKKMRGVRLPDTLTRIESGSFASCTELREIDWPESVTEMDDAMFINCLKLNRVRLPEGLKTVGVRSFENCVSLKKIEIPDSVVTVENTLFLDCASLCEVKLSARLRIIEPAMFKNCTALKKLEIPDGVMRVGFDAFSGCAELEEIDLPEVEVIGENAFANCTALKKVVLSRNVRQIEPHAFSGCAALKTIAFPVGAEAVNSRAFRRCFGLKNVEFRWSTSGGRPVSVGSTDFLGVVPPEEPDDPSVSPEK